MPDKFSIKSSAMDKFAKDLPRFVNHAEARYSNTHERPLDQMVGHAQGLAPRKSGRLVDSIGKGRRSRLSVYIEATAPHAVITEYGGEHPVYGGPAVVFQEARPFMKPAVDRYEDEMHRADLECVREAARKVGFR